MHAAGLDCQSLPEPASLLQPASDGKKVMVEVNVGCEATTTDGTFTKDTASTHRSTPTETNEEHLVWITLLVHLLTSNSYTLVHGYSHDHHSNDTKPDEG